MKSAKKVFLCLLAVAVAACIYARDVDKEMDKNWNMVLEAYRAAPNADATLEKINNFVERWKDSNRFAASRALYLAGQVHNKAKRYQRAHDTFRSLVDRFGNSPYADSAMYKMGECLYNMGKYAEAVEHWNRFRFKYTNSLFAMEAVYGIALSYLHLEEYKKADRDLNSFLEKNSHYAKDEKIRLVGGVVDFYLDKDESAIAKLKGLDSDMAFYYYGHSLLRVNKFREAAAAFKRIGDNYRNSKFAESALYNKAEAFYKGESYDAASQDYADFMKRFPGSKLAPYAQFKRGSSLFREKKYKAAAAAFLEVLGGRGDNRVKAYAQYLAGECQRILGDNRAALASYNRVIENYPEIFDAVSSSQLKAAWCMISLGNPEKAEELLLSFTQKFITHDSLPLGYYLLGTVYYNKKLYGQAIQAYKFLLDKFKYSDLTEAALLMMALCYYNQGHYSLLVSDTSQMLEVLSAKFKSPPPKIRARSYYYLGMAYFKMGMYVPASRAFREIIDKYYDSDITAEARANLAWCYYELENYKAARTMVKDMLSDPKIPDKVRAAGELLNAHTFFNEKDYDKASQAYGEFAYRRAKDKDFEPVAEALFQQGRVYEIQEYYNDAIKSWSTLAGRYPNSKRAPEAIYRLSEIYFKAQQFDKALMGFREIVTKWPNNPIAEDAMLSIAEVYYNSDQDVKAVKAYEDFMKKYPDSRKIGSVDEGRQRAEFKKADKLADPKMLMEFVEKYPNSKLAVDALYRAGEIYYTTNKMELAIQAFTKLIQDFPSDSLAVNAQYYIAACNEALERTDEAINAYKAFIKNYPRHELASDVMFRLATANYVKKNFEDAIFYYERIVERYPGSEYAKNALYNSALAYTELNKVNDAIRYYREFAKQYPDDPKSKDVPAQIAGMLLEQKRYAEAVTAYEELYAAARDDVQRAEALYRIGDIYSSQENSAKAIETFEKLMDAKPLDSVFRVTGLVNLAALYEERKEWVAAVRVYRAIAASGGQREYVEGARARIAEIRSVYPDLFKAEDTKTPAAGTPQTGAKAQ